ncbi:MAG: type II toxin-antitoxin system VapC family toxin [Clostridium sp.]|nr:type II toxin-antitoxin system VapC family toxin [Clostridium sp.]
MIFLDTCIWIELVAAKAPETPKEIKQASLASTLWSSVSQQHETVVTCKEQLIEIISAIQKYKMREHNRTCKNNAQKGVSNLKEFRATVQFQAAKALCKQAFDDVSHMSTLVKINIDIDKILNALHIVDINDCMYYEYCTTNNIDFYTFDGDFGNLEGNEYIHILS